MEPKAWRLPSWGGWVGSGITSEPTWGIEIGLDGLDVEPGAVGPVVIHLISESDSILVEALILIFVCACWALC